MPPEVGLLLPFVFAGALLYASVGHGGATVYLAILALAGYAVSPLVTTVLVLNILAAGIAFFMFRHAGHLRWGLLLPFVVTSVPMAYVGGLMTWSNRAQSYLLAGALLVAAARLLLIPRPPSFHVPRHGWTFRVGALLLGVVLGFLAGATGIGGGIFLSPILLVMGWANVKEAGSVASAFIVVNSLAGLAAKLPQTPVDVSFIVPMSIVVVAGAALGSFMGAHRLPLRTLQALLGLVLLAAGLKILWA